MVRRARWAASTTPAGTTIARPWTRSARRPGGPPRSATGRVASGTMPDPTGSAGPHGGQPVAVLEDLGRAPDDAPERVVHDDRGNAGRHLDPAGQAGKQRPAPGQPDLSP